jgi:hypothetical protein
LTVYAPTIRRTRRECSGDGTPGSYRLTMS